MIRMALAFLLLLTLGAAATPVPTAEGPVEGFAANGVSQFLGIPYAKPPVGPLRWMPPQPVPKWTAARKADKFGPTCAQVTTLGPFAGPANSNEDCLYLNVFTPNVKAKLPVLVWTSDIAQARSRRCLHGARSRTGRNECVPERRGAF